MTVQEYRVKVQSAADRSILASTMASSRREALLNVLPLFDAQPRAQIVATVWVAEDGAGSAWCHRPRGEWRPVEI